ncbi:PP2C family protein-serine/threonine phosphatase [Williamsoniiplasma lucivorax]|uniref:Phosphorylated protein phosphatase n=1 Tax=Williamsoniiplasma lucivorax TaxID=209274 RepID=A0A2S5RFQ3_9MOLU|nr:PP2C family serine/threonine-protein phosphatase [Williamsoniiplasma lucivorax]PPE06166.1 phosphorylated protein phosphatase [Williamsoniiplasma lucivorax]
MKYKAVGLTDVGNYRKNNQDNFGFTTNNQDGFFAIVCDGLGGHIGGEVASKIAVDEFMSLFKQTDFSALTNAEINVWLRKSINKILKVMKSTANKKPAIMDMGTTLTAILFVNHKGFVINIGDSRIHKFTNDKIYQITKDQNLWNETTQDERERVNKAEKFGPRLNEITYWKVLTSALGPIKTLKVDTYLINEPKGLYFLTSDGMHDYLDDETTIDVLESNTTLKKKAKELINVAKSNLSTDNLTIVLVEVK